MAWVEPYLHTKWRLDKNIVKKWTVSQESSLRQKQEGQHALTGQRAANFRLLANQ